MEFVHMKKIQKDGVSLSRRYITWVGTDCRDEYAPLCERSQNGNVVITYRPVLVRDLPVGGKSYPHILKLRII